MASRQQNITDQKAEHRYFFPSFPLFGGLHRLSAFIRLPVLPTRPIPQQRCEKLWTPPFKRYFHSLTLNETTEEHRVSFSPRVPISNLARVLNTSYTPHAHMVRDAG